MTSTETRENPDMKTRSVQTLVMACLLVATLAACEKKNQPSGFARPPAPVSVAAAVSHDVPRYLDTVGKIVASEVVSIQPQVSGRITEINFTDGANLTKGDSLFTIDPRPYEAQLHSADATLAEKKAALDLAKIQFQRYADLLKTNSVSQQDYDQKKNTLDMADAQVQQSQAAVETARLNLDYCFIRSPIEGRAGQRLVDIGNVVAANTGSLLVIQRLDPIYADFTITENDLTSVQRNMSRGILKAEVRLPDESQKSGEGTVSFMDNAVQDATGTVKLRATIPNRGDHFWPGRFVKVRLVLRTIRDAVLVPAAAPQMSATGPFVYVVTDDSTAELRPVKLGQRQDDLVVVLDGIKPGERVVVTGQLAVMPGAKVHVAESRAVMSQPVATKENGS
jgi:membrane fusion protein, multidrug efflux system